MEDNKSNKVLVGVLVGIILMLVIVLGLFFAGVIKFQLKDTNDAFDNNQVDSLEMAKETENISKGNQVENFINPVSNFSMCTSSFGCRLHPITGQYRYHNGIDIPVAENTPVYATKSGKVSDVCTDVTGYSSSYRYGNYVDIDHLDGTMTRYAHLKYDGVMVSVGTTVNQGQVIALSGNTGTVAGPQLHYEVYVNGVTVDPYNYLDISVISDNESCNYGKSVDVSYCGR